MYLLVDEANPVALTTTYSGAVIRTTHMTGLCTDIGNIVGQACRKNSTAEVWRLKVHVPLLLGYCFGGLLGQAGFMLFKENALLFPCFFSGTPFILKLFQFSDIVGAIGCISLMFRGIRNPPILLIEPLSD